MILLIVHLQLRLTRRRRLRGMLLRLQDLLLRLLLRLRCFLRLRIQTMLSLLSLRLLRVLYLLYLLRRQLADLLLLLL